MGRARKRIGRVTLPVLGTRRRPPLQRSVVGRTSRSGTPAPCDDGRIDNDRERGQTQGEEHYPALAG